MIFPGKSLESPSTQEFSCQGLVFFEKMGKLTYTQVRSPGYSSAWQSTCFGSRVSQVQILLSRIKKESFHHLMINPNGYFFRLKDHLRILLLLCSYRVRLQRKLIEFISLYFLDYPFNQQLQGFKPVLIIQIHVRNFSIAWTVLPEKNFYELF